MKHVVRQCIEHGLEISKTILMDATYAYVGSQKQRPLNVLGVQLSAVLLRRQTAVKAGKKLPKLPYVKSNK
ncbi:MULTISPECIES: hypothetical protein [unclassified Paenibacillus]|uniref:hypothetical protein n=1 Tax=unclassified Paenibacillus TaxID=185978 RepID=UPI0038372489